MIKARLALILMSQFVAVAASAQDSTTSGRRYYYEPRPLEPGTGVYNLGISMTLLPEPIVEQEIPAPALDLQIRYGLASDLSAFGGVSTNYFTNVLTTGLQWNTEQNAFSLGLGGALIGFAGFLSVEGQFDNNTAAALAVTPTLRAGYAFPDFSTSISFAATYLLHADTRVGSVEDQVMENRFNDFYFTLAFEQPFFKNTLVSTGISVAYSRTPYQSWMLFNTFDQFLMLPEFFFSFQL